MLTSPSGTEGEKEEMNTMFPFKKKLECTYTSTYLEIPAKGLHHQITQHHASITYSFGFI